VVAAVCEHVSAEFSAETYAKSVAATVNDSQRHRIIIERWKARTEPLLQGVVADTGKKNKSVDDLITELPGIFDYSKWSFSPGDALAEEKERVEGVLDGDDMDQLLLIVPGKQVLPVAAKQTGLSLDAYKQLVISALKGEGDDLQALGKNLEKALRDQLPPRYAAVAAPNAE
jgi:hypothetical protein